MNKSKVMMENDTPIYVNNTQNANVESYIYLGQRYTETKTNTRRFRQESRLDGQHSPSTATSSRLTLDMLEETSLQIIRTSSNDIRR